MSASEHSGASAKVLFQVPVVQERPSSIHPGGREAEMGCWRRVRAKALTDVTLLQFPPSSIWPGHPVGIE